jgi:hypothetical protein
MEPKRPHLTIVRPERDPDATPGADSPAAQPPACTDPTAYSAGFAAGLAAADSLRRAALERAEVELAAFKASDPEFYAHVRPTMADIYEDEARRSAWQDGLQHSAMAEVLRRDAQPDELAVLDQLKASRSRELDRKQRDAQDVGAFADLIRGGGEVTKTAADRLGIGMERAKRLRALAVELGLLERTRQG